MQLFSGLILLLCASSVYAQGVENPDVARARLEVDRIQGLVQAGALPPVQLDKARENLADVEDGVVLQKYIQQSDLTEDQANELVAAAGRRFDRRRKAFDEAKTLVQTGVAAQISLGTYLQNLDFARKECDLADTRAKLAAQINDMARAEELALPSRTAPPAELPRVGERFDGNGVFNPQILERIETAFEARFGHSLPVSADGETAVHRAFGFDHRGRVDVAIHPDQPEGIWLREYLTAHAIPFFAFRQAVPGKATGAHIHLGPVSTRLTPVASLRRAGQPATRPPG